MATLTGSRRVLRLKSSRGDGECEWEGCKFSGVYDVSERDRYNAKRECSLLASNVVTTRHVLSFGGYDLYWRKRTPIAFPSLSVHPITLTHRLNMVKEVLNLFSNKNANLRRKFVDFQKKENLIQFVFIEDLPWNTYSFSFTQWSKNVHHKKVRTGMLHTPLPLL